MREELLAIIEKNSRIDLKELAVILGVEEIDVVNELQALEEEGVICGYHTLINWEKTSLDKVTALIEVRVTPQRGQGFDNVAERIYKYPEVRSVYLISGGFLHADDNYGLSDFIRREMKKVFPELDLVELPFNHPIFHQKYNFPNGLPKIHEHDNKPPQAFALFYEGRMVFLFTYECDLGDGWEDFVVHKDSEATRTKALQMGANILQYVFTN